MNLADAIAVFDKSADRTRPNAQTEAWAVIRAELMRVLDAPVVKVRGKAGQACTVLVSRDFCGQRVRLVPADGGA